MTGMDEREDDPGADTAMFRAYVERGGEPEARASRIDKRAALAAAAVVVVLVVVALMLLT
jgi:hypothetical protein